MLSFVARNYTWMNIGTTFWMAYFATVVLGGSPQAGLRMAAPECAPAAMIDHDVRVVINNGFAQTEVTQTFFNPNDVAADGIYRCPVPQRGCLSDVVIDLGDEVLTGEVLTKAEADRIYGVEREAGNSAGKAEQTGYESYDFYIANIPARGEAVLQFTYYEPITIDAGVGRYVYALEAGGNDDGGRFWSRSLNRDAVSFNADITLKTAWPVEDVRLPGLERAASVQPTADGFHAHVTFDDTTLSRDLVFYYRLAENLPGRVELLTHRPDAEKPGTFMLVVTPSDDLAPLTDGADYLFVLDYSGSMSGHLATMASGIMQTLGELQPHDRFRIILFDSGGRDLTGWQRATPQNVANASAILQQEHAGGGTNLYHGLSLALNSLDETRATSLVLVTDGVANLGPLDAGAFHVLLRKYDLRFFGVLIGNQSNWPLMQGLADASGGTYQSVSSSDDIIGQIMQAKAKLTAECMHDAQLEVSGVSVSQTTDRYMGKVFRGQQLVIFGRFASGGPAEVTLRARLSGDDRTYATTVDFPETSSDYPEIERLWAMEQVRGIGQLEQLGLIESEQAQAEIEKLGVEAQIVTDYTSMVVLNDAQFAWHGVDRTNAERVSTELAAQEQRASRVAQPQQADASQPMFNNQPAYSSRGGGAFGPLAAVLVALVTCRARRAAT